MSHQRKKPFEPPGKKARFSVDEDAADGILPSEDPLRFLGFYDGQLKFNPPIVDDSLDPSKWSCFNPNEACYIRTYDENGKLLSKVFTTEERVVEDGKRVWKCTTRCEAILKLMREKMNLIRASIVLKHPALWLPTMQNILQGLAI